MNAKRKTSKGNFKDSIIKNILLMITLGVALLVASLVFLHIYTRQSKSVKVPNVRGKQLNEAMVLLKANGLDYEVIDSLYQKEATPGAIIEQIPDPNSTTKEGRKVFLTIYSSSPKELVIPDLADNSLRHAEALLISMGFEQITIEEVPSEHDQLVQAVVYRGRKIKPDEKIPAGAPLTIIVGSKSLLNIDNEYNSYPNNDATREPTQESNPIVDDSFF